MYFPPTEIHKIAYLLRPLSVSFQFRASGKETDMATPLGLEKYGRIDFSLGKLTI